MAGLQDEINAASVHEESVIVDGTCPGAWWSDHYEAWLQGGVAACVVTVASTHSARETLGRIGETYRLISSRPELALATHTAEIVDAKTRGKLAVVLQFQGTHPLEYDAGLAEIYARLGIRVVQLTYNVRSPVGDGCEEPNDSGLSRFGRRVVSELNRNRIVVDVSHTGERTSLDAIEASSAPVIASHSNSRVIHASPRNLSDELVRQIASVDGVIGAVGYGAFVCASGAPTLDQFIDHIAYMSELVGTKHVAIGMDYTIPNPPRSEYERFVDSGAWDPKNYPEPPWSYPEGLSDASRLMALTSRLLERGFGAEEVRGILGGNWLRVFGSVWEHD